MNLAGFFIALFFTLLFMPAVWKLAIQKGYYDKPGGRKIHTHPIPRLGGIAMALGMAISLLVLIFVFHFQFDNTLGGILAGGSLMFGLGLIDDLKDLTPVTKLIVQLGATVLAFLLNVQINTLDLPGAQLLILNALSLPVTILWIMGLMNAVNFIDGIDGLASGVTLLSAITLTIIAMFTNQPSAALLASILAGGSLGFLVFNFHPAKIFMGDCGALLSGFLLAAIAVTGVLKTKVVVMILPIVVLGVPILDMVYSVVRRVLTGKSPLKADGSHIHHQLLKSGADQIQTVSTLYCVCIIGGLIAVWYLNNLMLYVTALLSIFVIGGSLVGIRKKFWPNR
ncbi:MAG: MraY family glycosyltransferase [Cyanobacteria bacterium P01_H01_bin.74]